MSLQLSNSEVATALCQVLRMLLLQKLPKLCHFTVDEDVLAHPVQLTNKKLCTCGDCAMPFVTRDNKSDLQAHSWYSCHSI